MREEGPFSRTDRVTCPLLGGLWWDDKEEKQQQHNLDLELPKHCNNLLVFLRQVGTSNVSKTFHLLRHDLS